MIDEVSESGLGITPNMILMIVILFVMAIVTLYHKKPIVDNCAMMREAGIITTVEHYEAGCP